ncbi:MAG TPA: DUF5666 domain-containing protein, partial [Ktedonobacterales bacterium]|nr:DUF5666 domain-containing protein [Ktedonobacterales bacterium]
VSIFGAVLIASAGSAAALAASGANIQMPFTAPTSSQHDDGQQNGGQHNDGQDNDNDHDGHQAEGTISSIDAGQSSFVVKTEHGASVTVIVGSATAFSDGLRSFSDLKTGMAVEVDGTVQSDGTLAATRVHGDHEGADDDHSGSGSDDHSGSGASGSSTPGAGGHDDDTTHN